MQQKFNDATEKLLRQREATIQFGQLALQAEDLQRILDEACRLTASALGTDLSKVMWLEDGGDALRVIAGVGWAEGVVGEEKIPALERSSEGYALKTGRAAVSEDIDTENRFDYADFLKRHDVEAIVNVVIPGPDGKAPYGLLQVDSREPRDFSRDDIEFLQSYAILLGAAIERHEAQEQLRRALDVQERLFAELQHRIANSLTVITTLLRMKSNRAAHPTTQQDIADVLKQIDVLREVYAQLHASSNIDEIELGGYIAALSANIINFQASGRNGIRAEHRHDAVSVGADLAINLGLVINEFVTNSLKHASEDGLVLSTVVAEQEGEIHVVLADDGPGIGNAVDEAGGYSTGSGIGLIEGLLRQLRCEWDWDGEDGTRLSIRVPLTNARERVR